MTAITGIIENCVKKWWRLGFLEFYVRSTYCIMNYSVSCQQIIVMKEWDELHEIYVYRKVVIYVLINFQKSYSFSLYMYFFTMSEGPESTGGLGSSMATSGFGMDPDIARKIYYDTLCYQSVTFFF